MQDTEAVIRAMETRKALDSLSKEHADASAAFCKKSAEVNDKIKRLRSACSHIFGRPLCHNPERDPGEAPSYYSECVVCGFEKCEDDSP